jgi:hypothetical protein
MLRIHGDLRLIPHPAIWHSASLQAACDYTKCFIAFSIYCTLSVSTCDYRVMAPRDVWHSPWEEVAVEIAQAWWACSPSSLGIFPLWTGCTAWTGDSHGTAPGVCGPSLETSSLPCSCPRFPDPTQWPVPPTCNTTQTWEISHTVSCLPTCLAVYVQYVVHCVFLLNYGVYFVSFRLSFS